MGFSYVIEHMEEDEETTKTIPPWVELEYAHMRMISESDAHIQFTSLSQTSCDFINSVFRPSSDNALAQFSCHRDGVLELMKQTSVALDKVCLLDPKAEKELSPEDGDGRFEWFLFGGILGDDPPRDRTSELRVLGFPTRHLGPVQMTTDTALGVTKLVVHDHIPLNDIRYMDHPIIKFNEKESVEMPFRYIADGDKPRLPPGMKKYLHEDMNKSFEF